MVLIRFLVLTSLSILIGAFVAFGARDACAQSAACDSDFETVLNARATLEAMREVEVAQTLILKPDSVLEYSCFDDLVFGDLPNAARRIFSSNIFDRNMFNIPQTAPNHVYDRPGRPYDVYLPTILPVVNGVTTPGNAERRLRPGPNPPPFPPGALGSNGMANSLRAIVFDTMSAFLTGSFSHVYAGGSFTGGGGTIGTGVCNPMHLLWEFSKCRDFDIGWFVELGFLSGIDIRTLPMPCNDSNRASRWNAALTAAYPAPGTPGGVDVDANLPASSPYSAPANVYSHYNVLFDPSDCTASRPIPTGVRVYQGSPPSDVHADFVCAAPGCFYHNGAAAVPASGSTPAVPAVPRGCRAAP